MHELFASLAAWIISAVEAGGYLGVAGLTLLETLFPPIPSEVVLPAASFLVSQGRFSFLWMIAASTAGSLAGALALHALGRRLGEDRLRRFVRDHGRWVLLSERDVRRAGSWFARHGGKAVFFGRLVPTVRSVISIPAGVERMPVGPFVLYTALGIGAWSAVLVGAGAALGSQWERLEPFLKAFEWVGLLAAAAGIGWLVWRRMARGMQP